MTFLSVLCACGSSHLNVQSTSDIGSGWTRTRSSDSAASFYYLASDGAVIIGGEGEPLRSLDGGATWESLDSGEKFYTLAFGAGAFVATNDIGNVLISHDEGSSWQSVPGINGSVVKFDNGEFWLDASWHSPDGENWSGQPPDPSVYVTDFAWTNANGTQRLLAGHAGVGLFSSVDQGATWQLVVPDEIINMNAVASDDGVNAVYSDGGNFFASHDGGATWNREFPDTNIAEVRYLNGVFVAVGVSGTVLVSPDASAWQPQEKLQDVYFFAAVAFGKDILVGGEDGALERITWAIPETVRVGRRWRFLAANGATVVAVGTEGAINTSTDDGTSWSDMSIAPTDSFMGLVTGNDRFVAITDAGHLVTSSDGLAWTVADSDVNLYFIGFAGGKFYALSTTGTMLTSQDGVAWQQQSVPAVANEGVTSLALGEDSLVMGGWMVHVNCTLTLTCTAQPTDALLYANVAYGNGVFAQTQTMSPGSLLFDGAHFVSLTNDGTVSLSRDGVTWDAGANVPALGVSGLAVGDSHYVALDAAGEVFVSNLH